MKHSIPIFSQLRRPGRGLLAVTTGAETSEKILGCYLKPSEAASWSTYVMKQLSIWNSRAQWVLLGAPSDCGGGICRGAAHAPLALRAKLYKQQRALADQDLGDIPCIPHLLHDVMLSSRQKKLSGESLWGKAYQKNYPVAPLNLLEEIYVQLGEQFPHIKPFLMGGDHSNTGAAFAAMARLKRLKGLAVFHIDAHTDLLEIRFGVEHCFGTWTSHVLKTLPDPSVYVQCGIRISRYSKTKWERQYGLRQDWMQNISRIAPEAYAKNLLQYWQRRGCDRLYITNDIDGTDAREVPSTGTPEAKGLRSRWLEIVLKELRSNLLVVGADLMEVAPVLGSRQDSEKTLKVALRYMKAVLNG